MARTVTDAAILLGALTGMDVRDPVTRSSKTHAMKDYSLFLDKHGLQGARIGVARRMAGTDPRIIKIFEACLDVMKQMGAVRIDTVDVPNLINLVRTKSKYSTMSLSRFE